MQIPLNYDSKSEICALLKERGLSPTKKFGQNFMISPSAREKVLSFVNIKEGSYVWEIGGGLGSMTSMALKRVGDTGRLVVFEIDRGYISFLGEQFGANPGFEIAEGDMVKTWKGIFEKYGKPDVIFGNLPYNSASAMISSLIEGDCLAPEMVFTVQKEAGQRIAAKPGCSDYSSFSVLCQLSCDVAYKGDIKGGCFYPVPEVVSGIVTFRPRDDFFTMENRKEVLGIIRDIFSSRRKTILNNLRHFGAENVQTACGMVGIKPGDRGEILSPSKIVELASALISCCSRCTG